MVYNLQCNLNIYKNLEKHKQNQRGWGHIVVCSIFFLSVDQMIFSPNYLLLGGLALKRLSRKFIGDFFNNI